MPTVVLTDLPNADALVALPAEELAPIALRTAVEGQKEGIPIHSQSLTYRIYERERHVFEQRFPPGRKRDVENALGEAWQLLEREGFLMPEPGYNGNNGFKVL